MRILTLFARHGAQVRAADTRAAPPALGAFRAELPHARVSLGAFDEPLLEGVDAVVASPGVALREPFLRSALARGIEVVGDVEVFGRALGARTDGPRMRYQEVADLKSAQRLNSQGNYRFTWEIPERRGQFAFVIIAHGRDPNFLDSYSIKKIEEKDVD